MIQLKSKYLNILKNSKNLLAFSAGVDSSALFFLLLENNISFDMAFINYQIRKESKEEEEYAIYLAKKYNKKIFLKKAPIFKNNFEFRARNFRYSFFRKIINRYNYKNLLMGHQLNDKIEWFLMISSKGGGVIELSGMEDISSKEEFNIIRPLLDYTKEEILSYLQNRKIKFFIDKSNFDLKYERNRFRPIVEEIVKIKGKKGFIRTFNILQREAKSIKKGAKKIFKSKELIVAKIDNILFLDHYLSIYLKELNYLTSFKEREAILKNSSIVVGRKWAVEIENNLLYIAPYIKTTLPKEFKEICRINKIPPKIRGYLYKENLCNILIDTIKKNYLL